MNAIAAFFGKLDGWSIDTDVDARTTLGRMATMAVRAMSDPSVVHAANQVVAIANSRDYAAQIGAISNFMQHRFRFVGNPIGTQTIRPPGFTGDPRRPGMLEDIDVRGFTQGACDDAAVLIATLGMANALEARFRAVAFCHRSLETVVCDSTEPFSHVIADLYDGTDWVPLDVTKPYDLDRAPQIARTLIYNVS